MKVPNPVAPSTQPSSQGLAYLRPANTGLLDSAVSGIARNLQGIGAELSTLDERQQNELQANAHLQAYSDLSDLHTGLAQDLNKLKTDTSATENFPGLAAEHITPKINEFVAGLPKQLQPEFRYRTEVIKNSLLTDAHEFQDKQAVTFAKTHVEDAINKAKNTLRQNPTKDELKAQQAIAYAPIDAAPIDPASKVLEKRKADLELSQIVFGDQYNKFYQKQIAEAQAAIASGKPGSAVAGGLAPGLAEAINTAATRHGVSADYLARLAQIESSGGRNLGNPNSSAKGPFQIISSTARQLGVQNPMDFGESADGTARLTKENEVVLTKALGRAPTPGELYLAHQQGSAGAAALLTNPNELATNIVGYDAVRLNGGAPGMTAAQFANKWISKFQGGGGGGGGSGVGTATASKFDYSPDIENDPAFANIPLEDRINLQKDAYAQANGEITARNTAQTQLLDEARNQRYMNAEFADYGQTQFDQERTTTHLWDDFKDADKMQGLLNTKNKKGEDMRIALDMERSGAPFTNTEEGKKYANALIAAKGFSGDKTGLERLANGDHDYVSGTLIPTVQRINMIPPNVSSVLAAYAISADPKRMKFGFDTLLELKGAAPEAFNVGVPEQVRKDVAFYEQHKSLQKYTDEQMFAMMRPTPDDPNRQYETALREKADKLWSDGTVNPDSVIKAATAPATFSTQMGHAVFPTPKAEQAAMDDFKTVFEDEYVRSGDAKGAFGLATEWFNTVWGQNNVGGERYMMKHPPQSVGYQPMSGSLDWMTQAGHDELHIPPDHTFRLLSDQQTADEYAKWQHDPSAPPASYVVVENNGANGAGQWLTEGEVQKRLQRLPSEDTIGPLHLTTPEQHLYEHHLNNVKEGKFVRQEDGSISTILDITMEQDGRYRIIPTVWGGQVLPQNAAIRRAAAEGWSNWPSYASEDEANARYDAIHAEMEKDVTASALADAQRTVPFSDPAQSGLAPYRMHFVPSAADQADQEQYTRWQNAKSRSAYYDQHVYEPAFARAGFGEHPVPQDIIDEHNALEEAARAARPVPRTGSATQGDVSASRRFPDFAPGDVRNEQTVPSARQQLNIGTQMLKGVDLTAPGWQ
jgi:uncharacterized protein YejL (UPF0352 family)